MAFFIYYIYMVQKIFYQTSFPRAGSTLLQNILMQNPEVYSTPTDGVLDLLKASRQVYGQNPAIKAQDQKQMEKAFISYCKSAIYGFYNGLTNRPYVISKNRGYSSEYNFINLITPHPKMIVMVRDLREVLASMENNYQKNPTYFDPQFHSQPFVGTTVAKRVQLWLSNNPVGTSVERVQELLLHPKDVLFIRYEDLCEKPNLTMNRIYDYLGLPCFLHDFENIKQYTKEDDKWHGIYGDHKIRKNLKKLDLKSEKLLGKDVCRSVFENYQWFFNHFQYQF
jgi:hypothetical protein